MSSSSRITVEDILDEGGGIIKKITAPEGSYSISRTPHEYGGVVVRISEIPDIEPEPVKPCACFNVVFEDDNIFEVCFKDDCCFAIDFGELVEITSYEFYNGEYVITPLSIDQTLETRQKAMSDDLTVLAVPYTEVTNTSGGITVMIGS